MVYQKYDHQRNFEIKVKVIEIEESVITSTKPNILFWILGALFLLWNIFGSSIYLFNKLISDEALLAMENGEAMLAAREAYPIWAAASYALAVWGGLLAAIMVVLRKKLAIPLFIFSLVKALICFIPTFTTAEAKAAGGSAYWVMPLIVVAIGIVEVIWSRRKAADQTLT